MPEDPELNRELSFELKLYNHCKTFSISYREARLEDNEDIEASALITDYYQQAERRALKKIERDNQPKPNIS